MTAKNGWVAVSAVLLLVIAALGVWLALSDGTSQKEQATPTATTSSTPPPTPSPTPSPKPKAPDTASADDVCLRRTSAVLDAAITDIVARGDVGTSYARATRKYGDGSEEWRLASVLFPPVYAQLDTQGAASARTVANALVKDACGRLHDSKGSVGEPDLTRADPISLPRVTPSVATTTVSTPSPTTARSCYILEEAPRPFSGNWLTPESRGQFQDEVLMVQSVLNWLGYGCTPEDGDYGPETQALVAQFQSDYGLVVDGEVGPQTWNALFEIYD